MTMGAAVLTCISAGLAINLAKDIHAPFGGHIGSRFASRGITVKALTNVNTSSIGEALAEDVFRYLTAQEARSQPDKIAPGTVSLLIATNGVPSGYVTNTAAIPGEGIACIRDPKHDDGSTPNYETVTYTVIDGTHIRLNLAHPHPIRSTIAAGAPCIEEDRDR